MLHAKAKQSRTEVKVERLLTADEVAELLQVEVATIHQWRYRGKGPRAIKAGRKFPRFRPSDVNTWLDEQAEQDQAPPAA